MKCLKVKMELKNAQEESLLVELEENSNWPEIRMNFCLVKKRNNNFWKIRKCKKMILCLRNESNSVLGASHWMVVSRH